MKRGSPYLGQDEIRMPYFEFEKSGIKKRNKLRTPSTLIKPK
jgi:hypothetical protein